MCDWEHRLPHAARRHKNVENAKLCSVARMNPFSLILKLISSIGTRNDAEILTVS